MNLFGTRTRRSSTRQAPQLEALDGRVLLSTTATALSSGWFDPVDSLNAQIAAVKELELPKGLENSLVKKLEGAITKLEDGNPKNDGAALGKMQAFMNQALAQSGKKLPDVNA